MSNRERVIGLLEKLPADTPLKEIAREPELDQPSVREVVHPSRVSHH
jgi:hypothetical protein